MTASYLIKAARGSLCGARKCIIQGSKEGNGCQIVVVCAHLPLIMLYVTLPLVAHFLYKLAQECRLGVCINSVGRIKLIQVSQTKLY